MAVKYVKDFFFGPMTSVQRYAKGGHVKLPAKAKAAAEGMPSRAKPNAPARGAKRMESAPKVGKGQGYKDGGRVPGYDKDVLPTKNPPGRGYDLADSKPFKGEYQGYAKGGKVAKVMGEYKKGELHSGSKKGPLVKNPKQAIAIALSEARKSGAKISRKAEGGYEEAPPEMKSESFKEAFARHRRAGDKTFTWRGDTYTTKLASEKKSDDSDKKSDSIGKGGGPQSGRVYKTSEMRQREYYAKNPEPGAETGELMAMMVGPKAKAAAGAGALAAGTYAASKLRGALENMASRARGSMTDVARGDLAMARPAAARAAEAEAQMARFRNAQRSPGMTGYRRGGVMRKADGGMASAKELGGKSYAGRNEPLRGRYVSREEKIMREAVARAKQQDMEQKMRDAYQRVQSQSVSGLKSGGVAKRKYGGKC